MYKYKGVLVHQSHDEDGIVEVIEHKGVRSLHLGTQHRQSSMLVAEPQRLHLAYIRAMMGCLLFKETIDETLLVGLGGGSIAKYLLHHFSGCRIKALERSRNVVKIARSFFGLPLDPRLKIIIDDGGHYICQRIEEMRGQYGVLFVDAFDQDGISTSVNNEAFFDACKMLLRDNGLLVINLWGTDKALFEQYAWYLGRVFNWRILFLPVRGKGNIIGFAFADGVKKKTFAELKTRAAALERQLQIEFPVFVTDIRKHNPSVIRNVIKI